ncbi:MULTISPECIES: MGMT family protein [unclassified Pseudoalteromonas]|uniref:MGMT family protein n=1 Tax=unclassified Pseudoalteromonas TaxID=194690 RepID=UPI00390C8C94|nr:MGMT family protein [Ningiella sp. W23]
MDIDKHTVIYTIIASIPKGCVASYGQVAALAGYPNNARLVGRLLKEMPKGSTIPWHRVVNSQGKISFTESCPQYHIQRERLIAEGIVVINQRINMAKYRW